ncbi:MAG: hypothetical protein ACXVJK_04230, partial [Candidatus Aminicenantales bacterium]
ESEREVDFVTGTSRSPRPVEVKYVSSFDEGDKRYAGLRLFLRRFPETKKAVIVTKAVDKEEKINETPVRCVPLWKFLLDPAAFLS